jgi:hypothetical protein
MRMMTDGYGQALQMLLKERYQALSKENKNNE